MKLHAYTFFDQAADAYTQPFFLPNDGLAIRAFQDNVNSDSDNNMSLHPEQFKLFKIGEWDDEHATFTSSEKGPILLSNGHELVNPSTKNDDIVQAIVAEVKALLRSTEE